MRAIDIAADYVDDPQYPLARAWLIRALKQVLYTRCDVCGRVDSILTVEVGDHYDCLPF